MQSLFRIGPENNAGSFELRQWAYVRDGLIRNVEKVESFYQTYPTVINSSHLLVRLIQSVNISRNLPFDRYVANCNSRALQLSQVLKLTSALNKGQIWDGEFYGPGTKEIIIAHDTLFPLYQAYDKWKELHPVTVLQHNQTDTSLLLPDGRMNTTDKGVAIIAINIPMLMAMYYCYNQEQDKIELNGGTRGTIVQFVVGYALSGMVRSHLDNVVLNRLYNKVTGTPNVNAVRKHSFFLSDYDSALDTTAEQQVMYLKNIKRRFPGVMRATHLPISENLWEFSKLPMVPSTLQVYWALTLSRMKILAFLCLVQNDAERINGRELETIRTLMRMQETRKVIRNNLGLEGFYDIAPYLSIVGIE